MRIITLVNEIILATITELSQCCLELSRSYNKPPSTSGFDRHRSHPTTDTRMLMCFWALLRGPAGDTVMRERQTHLGLWTTARRDRAIRTESQHG